MRERLREKLEYTDSLLLDPFNPYPLEQALEELLNELKDLSTEKAKTLANWMSLLYQRLEKNRRIALGWFEELVRKME